MAKSLSNRPKTGKPEGYIPRKEVTVKPGKTIDESGRNYAKLITSHELAAYRIVGMMQPKELAADIDAPTMLDALRDQASAVQGGDMSQAEAMLINQASALQALFVRLSEKAMEQSHMPNLEGFMRLALRSQSQCRATLETLSAIKNPPVIYAKQVNQTTGPQQINNGTPSQARGFENEQSKLLDTRTAGEAIPGHSALEALGEIDRAKVGRG